MYTLVARIWRYRGRGDKPHSQWQAEIAVVEPPEPQVRRAVGLKNVARAIENFLRGKS
jgi:hypothetical protein